VLCAVPVLVLSRFVPRWEPPAASRRLAGRRTRAGLMKWLGVSAAARVLLARVCVAAAPRAHPRRPLLRRLQPAISRRWRATAGRCASGRPPGLPARLGRRGVALVDDPQQPGNRLLRLSARTDGTAAGTVQAQVCHARKYLEGTYAARVRFSDAPVQGPDGDVVVQTFYA
jgi:hypothetical protein